MAEISNYFDFCIKILYFDNVEYVSMEFQSFCQTHGILHQISCFYTQQNGIAERKNRFLEVVRSLLIHMNMNVPKRLWNFVVLDACFCINLIYSHVLENKSYFLSSFYMETFSCRSKDFWLVFVILIILDLDPRAIHMIFVGYSRIQKGYVCFDLTTLKVVVFCDVTFLEDRFASYTSPKSSLSTILVLLIPSSKLDIPTSFLSLVCIFGFVMCVGIETWLFLYLLQSFSVIIDDSYAGTTM